jgi:hypothetical protein
MDMSYFYAFFMIEDKDLKFVRCQLHDGVGAGAGFGTVGGVTTVTNKKLNVQEVVALDIQNLTKNVENAEGRHVDYSSTLQLVFQLAKYWIFCNTCSPILHILPIMPLYGIQLVFTIWYQNLILTFC